MHKTREHRITIDGTSSHGMTGLRARPFIWSCFISWICSCKLFASSLLFEDASCIPTTSFHTVSSFSRSRVAAACLFWITFARPAASQGEKHCAILRCSRRRIALLHRLYAASPHTRKTQGVPVQYKSNASKTRR